jgi:hypothetical protein
MKVKNLKNPAIFLWPAGTNCSNMAIPEFFFDTFLSEKSFVRVALDHFFHQVKQNTDGFHMYKHSQFKKLNSSQYKFL